MGIGDWGLGIGDWGLGPIPNPQSPIPNPQSPIPILIFLNLFLLFFLIKEKIILINFVFIFIILCLDYSLIFKNENFTKINQ